MLEIIASMIVPLLKWIFEMIAEKKLSDKEFVDYISAHQKRKNKAGQVVLDWDEALAKAKKEREKRNQQDTPNK